MCLLGHQMRIVVGCGERKERNQTYAGTYAGGGVLLQLWEFPCQGSKVSKTSRNTFVHNKCQTVREQMTGEVKAAPTQLDLWCPAGSSWDLDLCVGGIRHGNYRSWNIWQHASGLLFWEIPAEQSRDATAEKELKKKNSLPPVANEVKSQDSFRLLCCRQRLKKEQDWSVCFIRTSICIKLFETIP